MKTIITNAKVYLNRKRFAHAVLVEDGRIVAVGENDDIRQTGVRHIDADGALLLPGFYDSHLHLLATGRMSQVIRFEGLRSIEACVEHARREIERGAPGTDAPIIRADGLNQDLFSGEKRFPTRHDLDKITSDRPFFVTRVCGHIGFCNTKMLALLGLYGGETPDAGGAFLEGAERDADGVPNGILRGACLSEARDILPPETEDGMRRALETAMKSALANGITAAGSCDSIRAGSFPRVLSAYQSLYAEKKPALRIRLQNGVADDPANLDEYIKNGVITGKKLSGDFLKISALKLFADGSLGARTACMRQPYRDDPSTRGSPESDWNEMRRLIEKAHHNGFQVIVHAIGDAAIEAVVSAFESLGDPRNRLRHGIVHCQITDAGLLERIARGNILAFVQPVFLTNDLHVVEDRVGAALASSSYAWGTMAKLGIHTSYGTDAPVEPLNPLLGISCALTRADADGFPEHGFYPQERVDIWTAVDSYTRAGAYAHFDERLTGRIQTGFAADMVLLDRDIFTMPPQDIPSARPLWTMVDGEIVFD